MIDTITAIATGIGMGAIGIVRISGPDAMLILEKITTLKKKLKPNYFQLTHIIDPFSNNKIDQVLINYMPAPRSYTGEDTIEINCHGGRIIMNNILELIIKNGARLASPGEFTKRAFLNGKMDLMQAEAVMDMISARSREGAIIALGQLSGHLSKNIFKIRQDLLAVVSEIEALIDFPDDMEEKSGNYQVTVNNCLARVNLLLDRSHEGQLYREGVSVAIVGLPNVGKSSLLNYLLGNDRAIVSDIPGTTRDTIEEVCNIEGVPFRIIDTAGIRDISHEIERAGILRSFQKLDEAQIILFLIDITREANFEEIELLKNIKNKRKKYIIVGNKIDLLQANATISQLLNKKGELLSEQDLEQLIFVSLKTENGLENLKKMLLNISNIATSTIEESDYEIVSNIRHIEKLIEAKKSLNNVLETARNGYPLDFWSIDLKDSVNFLGEITGEDVTEEIIGNIFQNFCIGK